MVDLAAVEFSEGDKYGNIKHKWKDAFSGCHGYGIHFSSMFSHRNAVAGGDSAGLFATSFFGWRTHG